MLTNQRQDDLKTHIYIEIIWVYVDVFSMAGHKSKIRSQSSVQYWN